MSLSGRRRHRLAWALVAGVALLPAACQPLPHPFADDRPPAALMTVRDSISIAIAPVDGVPHATAAKLAPAVAQALLKRDIPASATTTGLNSYRLYGVIHATAAKGGTSMVEAHWRLRDAAGAELGERTQQIVAPSRDWLDGNDAAVAQLADASATALAELVQDERPVEAPAGGRIRVRVGPITGAKGDGDTALAMAITNLLRHQDVALVSAPKAAADLLVDAVVEIGATKAAKQHVKIVWRVRRPGGAEIGTVAQENDVPPGTLDGAWGDVAYVVAMSAQDGVMALIARAGPAAAAAEPAAPAPPVATTAKRPRRRDDKTRLPAAAGKP